MAKQAPVKKTVRQSSKKEEKAAIPKGLVATLKAKPGVKFVYISSDGDWKFNKVYADAAEKKYSEVLNPYFKEEN